LIASLNVFISAAIRTGNEPKLKDLLSHFKEFIDSHDADGNTLLIIGVINVQVTLVRMLLDEGADVNAPDSKGMTALHYAGTYIFWCWDALMNGFVWVVCLQEEAGRELGKGREREKWEEEEREKGG
jgi:hypothetical protein